MVRLVVSERDEQPIGDELDVLAHQGGVHADQGDRERIREELFLDVDRLGDDLTDPMRRRSALEVREEQAGKVGVEALVARDELVLGEGIGRQQQISSAKSREHTENVKPGMRPRFLSQKMEANEPEKKMPSTAAKATRRSAKTARGSLIHFSAHSALRVMHGTAGNTGPLVTDRDKGRLDWERTRIDGVEEICPFGRIPHVAFDQ